jgi:hypothetical protein
MWRELVAWWRSLEGLDDPTGDMNIQFERRLRSLEDEVRSLRQARTAPLEAASKDGAA